MLKINVKDSLFDPDGDPRTPVPYQRVGENTWYRVYIFLTGADVYFVEQASYTLPYGFNPRTEYISSSRSNPHLKTIIQTPSTGFEVTVEVWGRHFKHPFVYRHFMAYEQDVQRAKFVYSNSLVPR